MPNYKDKKLKSWKIRPIKKRYFGLTTLVLAIIFALLLVYQQTAEEPEVSYPAEPAESEKPEEIQPEQAIQPQKETLEAKPSEGIKISGQFYTATFSDSFSGLAWLDEEKTTLYFDWTGTNLLFPPKIEVKEILTKEVLNNFITEQVGSSEERVLFLGQDRLTGQKQILLWQPDLAQVEPGQEQWSKFDFSQVGLEQDIEVVAIRSQQTGWLVFAQQADQSSIIIYQLSVSPEKIPLELSVINKSMLRVEFVKDLQVACGHKLCLIYLSSLSGFWEFNIQSNEFQKLTKLSAIFQKQNPEQIVLAPPLVRSDLTRSAGQEKWLIAWAKGQQFKLEEYQPADQSLNVLISQSTKHPGQLAFLLLSDDKIFVFWASDFSQGYRVDFKGRIIDFSSKFGWRISANQKVRLYEFSKSIYIKNKSGSIIRWNQDLNVKINQEFWLAYTPNFLEIIPFNHQSSGGYLIAGVPNNGTKVYQFTDLGFNLDALRQVVSKKVNFSVAEIKAAQISHLQGSEVNSQIEYFLSNNGGENWHQVDLGGIINFETLGNDLRWKTQITPQELSTNYQTPYLSSINLKYWYAR